MSAFWSVLHTQFTFSLKLCSVATFLWFQEDLAKILESWATQKLLVDKMMFAADGQVNQIIPTAWKNEAESGFLLFNYLLC